MLISFHPFAANNALQIVAAAVDSTGIITELNDRTTLIPRNQFTQVEIPDDIDFRMFESEHFLRHSDLSHLLTRRNTQWVYGLALLEDVVDRRITQPVDFTQGIILIGQTNSTRVRLIVDDSDTNNIVLGLQEE